MHAPSRKWRDPRVNWVDDPTRPSPTKPSTWSHGRWLRGHEITHRSIAEPLAVFDLVVTLTATSSRWHTERATRVLPPIVSAARAINVIRHSNALPSSERSHCRIMASATSAQLI
jgi:hypothetical protein